MRLAEKLCRGLAAMKKVKNLRIIYLAALWSSRFSAVSAAISTFSSSTVNSYKVILNRWAFKSIFTFAAYPSFLYTYFVLSCTRIPGYEMQTVCLWVQTVFFLYCTWGVLSCSWILVSEYRDPVRSLILCYDWGHHFSLSFSYTVQGVPVLYPLDVALWVQTDNLSASPY